jgi:hypothetical protein
VRSRVYFPHGNTAVAAKAKEKQPIRSRRIPIVSVLTDSRALGDAIDSDVIRLEASLNSHTGSEFEFSDLPRPNRGETLSRAVGSLLI